jgi:hypothetical protein
MPAVLLVLLGVVQATVVQAAPPPDPLCLFTDPCKARPVITVRGCNPCYLTKTTAYKDQGASCHDLKDGTLDGQVVTIGKSILLTLLPGTRE